MEGSQNKYLVGRDLVTKGVTSYVLFHPRLTKSLNMPRNFEFKGQRYVFASPEWRTPRSLEILNQRLYSTISLSQPHRENTSEINQNPSNTNRPGALSRVVFVAVLFASVAIFFLFICILTLDRDRSEGGYGGYSPR